MIAACVFHACKLQKEPRSPKEIADIYDLEIRNVNKGCKKFLDYIDLSLISLEIKSSQSSDFIERFAKKLNIEKEYIDKAKDISININKLNLASTHEPPSVAAGCILLVSTIYHIDISKKNISEIFGISDVTISKTYRKIFPYHKIITNNEVTNLILEKKNSIDKTSTLLNEDQLIIKTDKITESESDYDNNYISDDDSIESNEYNILSDNNLSSDDDLILNKNKKSQAKKNIEFIV